MATSTSTVTYQGSKGMYGVYQGGVPVGTVTGGGKVWVAAPRTAGTTKPTYTGATRAAAVATMLAAPAPAHNGRYVPAAPGATTVHNMQALQLGGLPVVAHVAGTWGAQTLAVYVGATVAYQGPLPASITAAHQVNPWVAAYAAQWHTTTANAAKYGPCPPCPPAGSMAQRPRTLAPAVAAAVGVATPASARPAAVARLATRHHATAPTRPATGRVAPAGTQGAKRPHGAAVAAYVAVCVAVCLVRLVAMAARTASMPYAVTATLANHLATALTAYNATQQP